MAFSSRRDILKGLLAGLCGCRVGSAAGTAQSAGGDNRDRLVDADGPRTTYIYDHGGARIRVIEPVLE